MTDAKTSPGTRVWNWMFRWEALRGARAALPGPNPERAIQQVRLLVEVARRTADPTETLPSGNRSAVLISLYRDAVTCALAAHWSGPGTPAPSLETLWTQTPATILLGAAGDATALAGIKETLFEHAATGRLLATEGDATRVRAFAESLLAELGAPSRRVDQLLIQRWIRIGALAAVLLLSALWIRRLVLGPNLAEGKPFVTSSTYVLCANPADCGGYFFHTNSGDNPWVEFDLGSPEPIHRLEIKNRSDCCSERAIPLFVEISVDRVQWTVVAERKKDFDSWTSTFPSKTARYVRLRVGRSSILHLKEVVVR